MTELVRRFAHNPILRPEDVQPTLPIFNVACVLNPGAFRYEGRVGLLLRVAERPEQEDQAISVPVLRPEAPEGVDVLRFDRSDPLLDLYDPRIFRHGDQTYLTTLSHLRLAWSDDGEHFEVEPAPTLQGEGPLESFGIEDCRVSQIGDTYHLTYTAVSPAGVGIGLRTTYNWRQSTYHGMIFPPDNKDCAIFERKIGRNYYAFHRPANVHMKGNHIWLAHSPDLEHWGGHACIAMVRPGRWDSIRVGAGAAPIETPAGWLAIYHGADENHRYCLGALLLDLNDPRRVLARSEEPFMTPSAPYEQEGFFGDVVFTNGHIVDGDTITLYYGASDTVVCGARLSINDVLESLGQRRCFR